MSDNGLAEFDARNAGADTFSPPVPARAPTGQATQIEQARAIAEVRAAVMIAMDRPRDRTAAMVEMREVCGILSLAERAFFRVPRGKEHVNGESIHLARELARCWGNIDYGVKELARDDVRGQSELVAFCWDLQTNARSEITFIVPHVRGRANTRLTGTQEIYENNASFAGRRLREAIFAVLPVWFKAEAADICHQTLKTGGGKPFVQQLTDLRLAFDGIGVTAAQLELKRGRRIDDFTPEDTGALRVIYGSLKRGEVTVAEEFPSGDQQPPPERGDRLGAIERATIENSPAGPDNPEPAKGTTAAGATDGKSAPQPQPAGDAGARPFAEPAERERDATSTGASRTRSDIGNEPQGSPPARETPAPSDGPSEREQPHSAPRAAAGGRDAASPQPVGPRDGAGRGEIPPEASREGEVHRSPAAAQVGPLPWQQRFDALDPQVDLADAPNWIEYARDAIALIGEATAADLAALRLTANSHMQALRRGDGDKYRQITEAIAARAKALAQRATA